MVYYPKIKILRKESGKSKKEIVNYLGTKKKYYWTIVNKVDKQNIKIYRKFTSA